MLRDKKSLLRSLFCSLGRRDNYLVISHELDGEFVLKFCQNASYIMIIFLKKIRKKYFFKVCLNIELSVSNC